MPKFKHRIKSTQSALDQTTFLDQKDLKKNLDRYLIREVLLNQKAIMEKLETLESFEMSPALKKAELNAMVFGSGA